MFSRIDAVEDITSLPKSEKHVIYKFICKTSRDFKQPSHIIFTDLESKSEHAVAIRRIGLGGASMDSTRNKLNIDKSLLTVCLDLNLYNRSYQDSFVNDTTIFQFFLVCILFLISIREENYSFNKALLSGSSINNVTDLWAVWNFSEKYAWYKGDCFAVA
jgi:hypothetical protein